MPFMADMFPTVVLGSNNGGFVRWSEQLAVTNNAGSIAEATAPTTQSNLTWVEKSIEGRRLSDFIKIGLDQINDVDYVLGEVQALVNKNMKIKENTSLISGTGLVNEIAGIEYYATPFVTAGVSKVVVPNLVDLVNKIGLQIQIDMLGGAYPTNFVASPIDIQPLKEAKDTMGRYIFEAWALGATPSFGGVSYVSNPLATADTLIVGDFNMATLFVFDDLLIEMVRTSDDEIKRMVTIFAYKRENLRVKDVDKKAFVKVDSVATALSEITAQPQG
jgi:HK97 family phage major capsid protein